jgi:hypothetical protein
MLRGESCGIEVFEIIKHWIMRLLVLAFIPVLGNQLFSADFGVKLGLGLVNLKYSEDSAIHFSPRQEFVGGIFFSFNIMKNLALQPELYYLRKGSNTTDSYYGIEISNKWVASAIEASLLLKYRIPTESRIKPHLFLGPYSGAVFDIHRIQNIQGEIHEIDLLDNATRADFGLIVGGCLEFNLGPGKCVFDIRYSLGIRNIDDYMRILPVDYEINDTTKNQVFMFLFG